MAEIATQDNSALLNAILGAISGKSSNTTGSSGSSSSGTSSSTSSTKGNLTKEGIDAMIQEVLSQAGTGVADIATGAHAAGLYDSTTQSLLTGNLVAKTAGELAKAQAGTTTTQTGTQSQTGTANQTSNTTSESPLRNIDLSALAGAGGLGLLATLLGPSLKGGIDAATGGLGLGGLGQALRDALFPPMVGPNQTSGEGIGQIGASQLTPQQIEAQLGSSGGIDLSSLFPADFNLEEFFSSLESGGAGTGLDVGLSGDFGSTVDFGDWWDPSWGP